MTATKRLLLTLAIALLFILVAYVVVGLVMRVQLEPRVPAPVPLRVDPALAGQEARIALRDPSAGRFDGGMLVRVVDARANPLKLEIFRLDLDADTGNERLDLSVTLGKNAAPAQVELIWYDDRQIAFFSTLGVGEDIRGLVTVDADRVPTPGDDRIIAYDLQALREGTLVSLNGRVRVSAGGR